MVSFGQNSIGTASDIAKNKYQTDPALVDAELYGDLRKSLGEKPRGWRAGVAGLLRGMEHGSKLQASEKFNKTMDYLESVNNSAIAQNEWYQKQEFAKQKAMPQILSYIDNVQKLDPLSRRAMLQGILDQYNQDSGNDYKLKSEDSLNPFLVTLGSSKGEKTSDIRNLFMSDKILQQRMAMKTPEYLEKMQQERDDKLKKFEQEQQKIDINKGYLAVEKENAPLKYATQQSRIDETRRRTDQAAHKADLKLTETLGKKIDAAREFLTIAPEMKKIVKNHPDIYQSAIDVAFRETKEPGYFSNLLKTIHNKLSPEKVTALTTMVKYINKMTLDVANGFARPNMFIEKVGSKAVPNLDMNAQGFEKIVDEMIEENKTSIKNNQARFDLLRSDLGEDLASHYKESTSDVMNVSEDNDIWNQIGTPVQ